MHPPFFQGVLVPLIMTNPVRFMTNELYYEETINLTLRKAITTSSKLINKYNTKRTHENWQSYKTKETFVLKYIK